MTASKFTLTATTAALLTGSGSASAHPAGHGGFGFAELAAHLAGSTFHVGIALAAVVAVMLLVRKPRRQRDQSEAAHE